MIGPNRLPVPVRLLADQKITQPIGFGPATPAPDHTSVTDARAWLFYDVTAAENEALIRFEVSPSLAGFVPMHPSDGTQSVSWSMLMVA